MKENIVFESFFKEGEGFLSLSELIKRAKESKKSLCGEKEANKFLKENEENKNLGDTLAGKVFIFPADAVNNGNFIASIIYYNKEIKVVYLKFNFETVFHNTVAKIAVLRQQQS